MSKSSTKTAERVEHTPGPWQSSHGGSVVIGGEHFGTSIAETYRAQWVNSLEHEPDRQAELKRQMIGEAEANARLIAAAPELLEALEECLADLEHYVSTHGPGPDVRLAKARAAIAKARGQ